MRRKFQPFRVTHEDGRPLQTHISIFRNRLKSQANSKKANESFKRSRETLTVQLICALRKATRLEVSIQLKKNTKTHHELVVFAS